jgi:Transposase
VLFVGDDWAEGHHHIEITDEAGPAAGRRRLPDGVAGIEGLHGLVADHLPEAAEPAEMLVGIETDRGPCVQALVVSGYTVYAINSLQVTRYRQRHAVSGAKSDRGTRTRWPRSSGWTGRQPPAGGPATRRSPNRSRRSPARTVRWCGPGSGRPICCNRRTPPPGTRRPSKPPLDHHQPWDI